MSLHVIGRVAGTGLLLAWVSACGDTTGTPLVAEPPPGVSTDPPAPSDDGQLAVGPVFGLCDPCEESEECGDGNDFCVRRRNDTQRFCTRDCQEGRGCPEGYQCIDLANSSTAQCVPLVDNCSQRLNVETPPRLAVLRAAALEQLNVSREQLGAALLAPDECLNEIAQTSTREYALNGQRGTKYARECEPDLLNCACGWATEYQVTIVEYELSWTRAVTLALEQGFGPTTSGADAPLATTSSTRVGIGVLLGGDEAWISFALGE